MFAATQQKPQSIFAICKMETRANFRSKACQNSSQSPAGIYVFGQKLFRPQAAQLRSGQEGFAILSITFLMVFIAALIVVSLLGLSLKLEQESTQTCRKLLLTESSSLAAQAQRLRSFNPEAQKLRTAKKTAETSLALAISAGNPSAIAMAQKWLKSIIQAQKILNTKQLLTLSQMQTTRLMLRTRLQADLNQAANYLRQLKILKVQITSVRSFAGQNALIPDRAEDLAPVYELGPQLPQLHEMSANWTLRISNNWLAHEKLKTWTLPISCQSTFFERGQQWFATLVRDKS